MAIDLEKFVKAKRFTTDHTLDDATDQVLVKTTAGSSVGDAIAAAIAANNTAQSAALNATAAETIAGTVAAKFVSPDDLKATFYGSDYPIALNYRPGEAAVGLAIINSATGNYSGWAAGTAETSGQLAWSNGTVHAGVYGKSTSASKWAGYFDGNVGYTGEVKTAGYVGYPSTGGTANGVLLGSTYVVASRPDNWAMELQRTGSDGGVALFYKNNVNVGNIAVTSAGTSYSTNSDYRLKTVDGPVTNSGAFIDALKPVTGEWKAEPGKKANFFIAHEVQEVSPSSVNGKKDAVESFGTFTRADGSTQENVAEPLELRDGESWEKTGERAVMQSMEYGSADFIVNMIAELQDLRKRVAALEGAVL